MKKYITMQLLAILLVYLISEVTPKNLGDKTVLDNTEELEPNNRVKRVISGSAAMLGDWPWLVHIRAKLSYTTGSRKWYCLWLCGKKTESKTVNCGASIIDNRWLITAAHCVYDTDRQFLAEIDEEKSFHVTSGEVTWPSCSGTDFIRHWWTRIFGGDTADLCHIHSMKIIRHPQYQHGPQSFWNNDIALIKLEKDILGNDYTAPIELPPSNLTKSWPAAGSLCHAHGWGCTEVGGSTADGVMNAEIPTLSNEDCEYSYGSRMDTDTHICAGGQGSSVCNGDSGGPLVCYDGSDAIYQAGVVSFFTKNSPTTQPSGFTRVSEYVPWIRQVIANN